MNTEYAWLAGLIDGEGCFQIQRRNGHVSGVTLTIGMTSLEALEQAKQISDCGSVIQLSRPTVTGKVVWRWQVSQRQLEILLPNILPYLVVKRAQALDAQDMIRAFERSSGHRLSEIQTLLRETFAKRISAYNSRQKVGT